VITDTRREMLAAEMTRLDELLANGRRILGHEAQ
jgi:hypothetical protein